MPDTTATTVKTYGRASGSAGARGEEGEAPRVSGSVTRGAFESPVGGSLRAPQGAAGRTNTQHQVVPVVGTDCNTWLIPTPPVQTAGASGVQGTPQRREANSAPTPSAFPAPRPAATRTQARDLLHQPQRLAIDSDSEGSAQGAAAGTSPERRSSPAQATPPRQSDAVPPSPGQAAAQGTIFADSPPSAVKVPLAGATPPPPAAGASPPSTGDRHSSPLSSAAEGGSPPPPAAAPGQPTAEASDQSADHGSSDSEGDVVLPGRQAAAASSPASPPPPTGEQNHDDSGSDAGAARGKSSPAEQAAAAAAAKEAALEEAYLEQLAVPALGREEADSMLAALRQARNAHPVAAAGMSRLEARRRRRGVRPALVVRPPPRTVRQPALINLSDSESEEAPPAPAAAQQHAPTASPEVDTPHASVSVQSGEGGSTPPQGTPPSTGEDDTHAALALGDAFSTIDPVLAAVLAANGSTHSNFNVEAAERLWGADLHATLSGQSASAKADPTSGATAVLELGKLPGAGSTGLAASHLSKAGALLRQRYAGVAVQRSSVGSTVGLAGLAGRGQLRASLRSTAQLQDAHAQARAGGYRNAVAAGLARKREAQRQKARLAALRAEKLAALAARAAGGDDASTVAAAEDHVGAQPEEAEVASADEREKQVEASDGEAGDVSSVGSVDSADLVAAEEGDESADESAAESAAESGVFDSEEEDEGGEGGGSQAGAATGGEGGGAVPSPPASNHSSTSEAAGVTGSTPPGVRAPPLSSKQAALHAMFNTKPPSRGAGGDSAPAAEGGSEVNVQGGGVQGGDAQGGGVQGMDVQTAGSARESEHSDSGHEGGEGAGGGSPAPRPERVRRESRPAPTYKEMVLAEMRAAAEAKAARAARKAAGQEELIQDEASEGEEEEEGGALEVGVFGRGGRKVSGSDQDDDEDGDEGLDLEEELKHVVDALDSDEEGKNKMDAAFLRKQQRLADDEALRKLAQGVEHGMGTMRGSGAAARRVAGGMDSADKAAAAAMEDDEEALSAYYARQMAMGEVGAGTVTALDADLAASDAEFDEAGRYVGGDVSDSDSDEYDSEGHLDATKVLTHALNKRAKLERRAEARARAEAEAAAAAAAAEAQAAGGAGDGATQYGGGKSLELRVKRGQKRTGDAVGLTRTGKRRRGLLLAHEGETAAESEALPPLVSVQSVPAQVGGEGGEEQATTGVLQAVPGGLVRHNSHMDAAWGMDHETQQVADALTVVNVDTIRAASLPAREASLLHPASTSRPAGGGGGAPPTGAAASGDTAGGVGGEGQGTGAPLTLAGALRAEMRAGNVGGGAVEEEDEGGDRCLEGGASAASSGSPPPPLTRASSIDGIDLKSLLQPESGSRLGLLQRAPSLPSAMSSLGTGLDSLSRGVGGASLSFGFGLGGTGTPSALPVDDAGDTGAVKSGSGRAFVFAAKRSAPAAGGGARAPTSAKPSRKASRVGQRKGGRGGSRLGALYGR